MHKLTPDINLSSGQGDSAIEGYLLCCPGAGLSNLSLGMLQSGQYQSAGRSSQGVPGATPCVGSPISGL